MLLVDPVGALAPVGFEGLDGVPGLLHRAGHEASNGVSLPAHRFHDLGQCGAVLPLQHGDHLGRLGALAGAGGGWVVFASGRWSLTSLQRLVKTGGRLVKHARYYWLMLAESHLTRRLFVGRIAALPVFAG